MIVVVIMIIIVIVDHAQSPSYFGLGKGVGFSKG